jgi:dTDP-4-dehydrorhamnose 3,5-epimerase
MTTGGADTTRASALDGVRTGRLQRHADERGAFRELWRASSFGDLDPRFTGRPDAWFVQANLSTSLPGVLRGLHYHRRQLDYWVVTRGRVFAALVDVRPVLSGEGSRPIVETHELAADDWLVIPAGVAHGFLALEELEVLYLVTAEYDGSDELGFAWDDPAVGVPWPIADRAAAGPILSDRDRANPPLAELLRRLGAGGTGG